MNIHKEIHRNCPFLQPITKEVIESLGWTFQKHWVSENDGEIFHNNLRGLTWFKKTNTVSIWERVQNDFENDTYFIGKIHNSEHLKFILKLV